MKKNIYKCYMINKRNQNRFIVYVHAISHFTCYVKLASIYKDSRIECLNCKLYSKGV